MQGSLISGYRWVYYTNRIWSNAVGKKNFTLFIPCHVIQLLQMKRTKCSLVITLISHQKTLLRVSGHEGPSSGRLLLNPSIMVCYFHVYMVLRWLVNVCYTVCPRRNVPDFGRVFLMLKYTDITQNTYIQSWTVTEIMAREVWNFDSCYTLINYQIHIKTGRNMLFL